MNKAITFHVPFLGRSTNHYHKKWRDYGKDKKQMAIAMSTVMKKVDAPLFDKAVHIEIQPMCGPKQRRFDCSNFSKALKMIEDCLVDLNVLADDSINHVASIAIKRAIRVKAREDQGHRVWVRVESGS